MQLQDYINDVQEILHDSTASSWPTARVISRINEARIDTARDCHCIRQNVTGIQLLEGQEIYNLQGAVAGCNVLSGGSNFNGPTTPVVFSPPPQGPPGSPIVGVQAAGFANVTNGVITSVTMTQWGQGYTAACTATAPFGGSGALLQPVNLFTSNPLSTVIGNPLAITKISFIWNNERRTLKHFPFRLFDAYARMWTVNTFIAPPGVWTNMLQSNTLGIGQTGGQIWIQPPPDQLYISEWDIVFQGNAPLVATTDVDTQLVDPWARAVQFRASELLLMKHRNWGEVNALAARYDSHVPRIITTMGGYTIMNIYNRNYQRMVMR
ncbi:MAG TPA: hypothetical protein VF748_17690 [Candidatus Acidoferrum sp.]